MRRARDESGVALLVVLLVITLLTVVVIEFTYSAQVETHLAFGGRNALQATYLARSGINMAEGLLRLDELETRLRLPEGAKDIDSALDVWAKPLPPYPLGDGTVEIRIVDESRFLNVNEIVNGSGDAVPDNVAVLRRLFARVGVDLSVLSAIIDWIDRDNEPFPSPAGAEQSFYFRSTPPVRVRNGPVLTLRELRLVRGVTPQVLQTLEKYLTAIPRSDALTSKPSKEYGMRVNVNTAPEEALIAVLDDPQMVAQIADRRRFQPIEHVSDVPNLQAHAAVVRLNSRFFRIESVGSVSDVRRAVVATVQRDPASGVGLPKLTRSTWFPNAVPRSLTSLPASGFLPTLPPLGGST